jgi:hypothetical protein
LNGNYFPSYEIVNDELRDYRFFKEDLVHPNQLAIDYIWDKFKSCFMDVNTNMIIEEVVSIRRMMQHKTLYPNSIENKKFQDKIEQKKNAINLILPNIKW